jgi:hypothetical protein
LTVANLVKIFSAFREIRSFTAVSMPLDRILSQILLPVALF